MTTYAYLAVAGIVVVAAMTPAAALQTCPDLSCPEPNGFFAHPTHCHQYVKCENGQPFVTNCPANLHYNEREGHCDLSDHAQCDIPSRLEQLGCSLARPTSTRATVFSLELSDLSVECDCECCLKPHRDCNKYFECKNHTAFERACGEGLVYNPNVEQCDKPTNYECPKLSICGCHCRYPVEEECDAYYDCREGEAEKRYCSSGLLFNPETRMCDNADAVACPEGPPPTPTPATCHSNVFDSDPDCKFWSANNDCVCKSTDGDCSWQHFVARACPRSCACQDAVNTPAPPVDYPCVDCSTGQQYWQHPSNCHKFIQCAPYGPQEMSCPEGTQWNQTLLTCDHTWRTTCVTGNFLRPDGSCSGCIDCPISPPLTTPADPVTPRPQPPPARFDCVDCSSGQQYWQHPSDCQKFIQCAPYGPQEMPCAAGTRWNQTLLTCDHTWRTQCVTWNYEQDDGSCVYPPVVTQPPPPPPTTDCVDKNTDCKFWAKSGSCECADRSDDCSWQNTVKETCPKSCNQCGGDVVQTQPPPSTCDMVCPSYSGLFPHPKDCNKWIHCSHNIPYVKDCPANLHFNPTLKVCDWPYRAGCSSSEEGECGVITLPTTPAPTGPPATPDPRCTCTCCHMPHPEDCTAYYYCDANYGIEFHSCSEGLVFNPNMSTCVYANEYPECSVAPPPECKCDCFYPASVCSEFFKCENGVPEKRECTGGLHWNDHTKSCDLPESAGCAVPMK